MKNLIFLLSSLSVFNLYAQQNIDDLLAAGINDAQRFTSDYLKPASDGLMYSMNNGWFNDAKVGGVGHFEISLVLNAAFVSDENKSFLLDTSEYDNLQFRDGSITKEVATAFGDISGILVFVEGESTVPGFPPQEAEFELPTGLGESNINFVPTAFIQANFTAFKGTEIKARYFPKVNSSDAEIGMYGAGLQHEFTSWIPGSDLLPVAISGLVAFTHLDGQYDFTSTSTVDGENQRLENTTNTTLFQLIGSTKLPIFNVYAGLGYITGTSTNDLKGTYRVRSGVVQSETIVDPFSIESSINGLRGSIGAKVSLGLFKFNADYTIANYSGFSFGLNLGW